MDLLSESTNSESKEGTFVFQLPNELLEKIFSYVFDVDDDPNLSTYTTRGSLVALSRTCKRFHPVAQHVLYQDPCMEHPMLLDGGGRDRQVKAFHRKLNNSPNLQSLCKRFSIEINDNWYHQPRSDIRFANEVLLLMTNLTHLNVTAHFHYSETWSAINGALKNMHSLQELALLKAEWSLGTAMGPPLQRICRDLDLPSLRVLELDCATASLDLGLEDESKDWFRGTELVPVEKQSTGAFKSLHIVMPEHADFDFENRSLNTNSIYLKELLTWPKALEHFSFHPTWGVYSLDDIQESIQPFCKTLKSLTLGVVRWPRRHNSVLNLKDFEELESLDMDLIDLYMKEAEPHQQGSPELAATSLCGPKLRSLTIDFRSDFEQADLALGFFGDKMANWIHTFSQHARAKGSSLSDITLWLSPSTTWGRDSDFRASLLELLELFGTLDRLKDGCRELGIEFHYFGPREEDYREGFRVVKI